MYRVGLRNVYNRIYMIIDRLAEFYVQLASALNVVLAKLKMLPNSLRHVNKLVFYMIE